MTHADTTAMSPSAPETASWGAVFALTLCVATMIASEFIPVSLMTPIASDLGVSEGTAGQAIAVSGLFAVLTSLSISGIMRGIDRRLVLLNLTLLMMISGVMVAFAPNSAVFIATADGGAAYNANAGQITSAGPPRQMQLGLKLLF